MPFDPEQLLRELETLDFMGKAEAFVGSRFLTPLLACLGYETHKDYEVIRQSHRSAFALLPDTFEKARKACPGYDVYALEGEWRNWASSKEAPKNADVAFIAFCKTYAERHPLNS